MWGGVHKSRLTDKERYMSIRTAVKNSLLVCAGIVVAGNYVPKLNRNKSQ
jgi:hypothetical protein